MFLLILKTIAVITLTLVLTLVLLLAAGWSGVSFYLWPTSLKDHDLSVTPELVQRLRELQSERKFGPDPASLYPGAINEADRLYAQLAVDSAIQALMTELPGRPQRSTVLRVVKHTLANFKSPESEERDQILVYLERVMDICGVQSSGELLNVWRYGFPFGWFTDGEAVIKQSAPDKYSH